MSTRSPENKPYRALYRSWRPQFFSEVVGQEHVVRTLQNALAAGRVAHAYLFCGLRGTGKTTMAKLLAKALNCLEGINPEPCGRCRSCQEVMDGRNMDVLEIDAASNRGIDEIRDLRDKARYAAAQNRFKVYIIDEVHMLTNEAFNALLKILEEPPPGVVFILATTEVYKLPLTVVSRCQRFDFHLLEGKQVVGRLQEVARGMNFSVEEETLYLLARQAEGSMRDALGLLEQCRAYGGEKVSYSEALEILGLTAPEAIYNLLQAIVEGDNLSGLAAINEVVSKGKDLQRFLQEMTLYLRRLVLLQSGSDEEKTLQDVPGLKPYLLRHKDKFNDLVLLEMLEILQGLSGKLRNSSQPSFLLELAFLRLVRVYRFRDYLSPEALLSRLEELEEKLQSAGLEGLNAGTGAKSQASGKEKPAAGPERAAAAVDDSVPGEILPPADGKAPAGEETASGLGKAAAPEGDPGLLEGETHSPAGSSGKVGFEEPEREAEREPEREVDLEQLREIWHNKLLPEIKKQRKHNIYALLQDGRPFSCKKGVFTICLPQGYSFHKGRIESTRNKKYIESLLKYLLGYAVDLRVILQEKPEETGNWFGSQEENTREENPREEITREVNAEKSTAGKNAQGKSSLEESEQEINKKEKTKGKITNRHSLRSGYKHNPLNESGAGYGAGGTQISGDNDYFIREMLELFDGKLIEAGSNELKSREFWSFSIDSVTEETDE
ncbi:MAG: DNA polymerase III subunit gamma/tau [Firmicutes bacterium]|nr:DNA polymerase III subunit gamma/tau [Bacillota bacterium]